MDGETKQRNSRNMSDTKEDRFNNYSVVDEIDEACGNLKVGESYKIGKWVCYLEDEENPDYENGVDGAESYEPFSLYRDCVFYGRWDIGFGDFIYHEEQAIKEKEDNA